MLDGLFNRLNGSLYFISWAVTIVFHFGYFVWAYSISAAHGTPVVIIVATIIAAVGIIATLCAITSFIHL